MILLAVRMPTPPILQHLRAIQEEENIQERLTDPLRLIQVSKSSEESGASRIWKAL